MLRALLLDDKPAEAKLDPRETGDEEVVLCWDVVGRAVVPLGPEHRNASVRNGEVLQRDRCLFIVAATVRTAHRPAISFAALGKQIAQVDQNHRSVHSAGG